MPTMDVCTYKRLKNEFVFVQPIKINSSPFQDVNLHKNPDL